MKKIKINLLTFGAFLICTFAQTHGDDKFDNLDQLKNSNKYPYLDEIIRNYFSEYDNFQDIRIGENGSVSYQENDGDRINKDNVFRKKDYKDLTDFEKQLFDYYEFDQNQPITIVGVTGSSDNLTELFCIDGSMSANGKIQYIKWKSKTINYRYNCTFRSFSLFDEKDPSFLIASAEVVDAPRTKTVTYTYVGKKNR